MMEHLQKLSGGRHAIDDFEIMSDMQKYFNEAASITVYINMIETAQKKAARAKLPISDNILVSIATKAILASDRFPQTTDAWEEKTYEDKTWAEWKGTYLTANESRENRLRAAGDTGGGGGGLARPTPPPPPPMNNKSQSKSPIQSQKIPWNTWTPIWTTCQMLLQIQPQQVP